MTTKENPAMISRLQFLGMLTAALLAPATTWSQTTTNFSGTWKQNNDRCIPKRKGDVTLHIDQHGSDFTVETTVLRPFGAPRHAVQRYTTDGKPSISTGADGDEFHTSIVINGQSLVFSIEEHEDGRVILSKETWTLIENGSTLQRKRKVLGSFSEEGTGEQTLIYALESPDHSGRSFERNSTGAKK
jgi:hypothetical protein